MNIQNYYRLGIDPNPKGKKARSFNGKFVKHVDDQVDIFVVRII